METILKQWAFVLSGLQEQVTEIAATCRPDLPSTSLLSNLQALEEDIGVMIDDIESCCPSNDKDEEEEDISTLDMKLPLMEIVDDPQDGTS